MHPFGQQQGVGAEGGGATTTFSGGPLIQVSEKRMFGWDSALLKCSSRSRNVICLLFFSLSDQILLLLTAQYFASIMVIVGLSVVVTVLVLQFHHHDPQAGKMPRWVSRFGSKCSTAFKENTWKLWQADKGQMLFPINLKCQLQTVCFTLLCLILERENKHTKFGFLLESTSLVWVFYLNLRQR